MLFLSPARPASARRNLLDTQFFDNGFNLFVVILNFKFIIFCVLSDSLINKLVAFDPEVTIFDKLLILGM